MSRYRELAEALAGNQRRWLVTGVAGFIGSHLLEALLRSNQQVVGIDNFATGYPHNLADVEERVGSQVFANFQFLEGDICNPYVMTQACHGVDVVLHEAALGSVPRSMVEPAASHVANVDGFLNVLLCAGEAGVRRVVYASSSSVYGDDSSDIKHEDQRGRVLSPYAATKLVDEVYADAFRRTHAIESVGLRYFNVFGPRQDPAGAYAAVIPRWTQSLLSSEPCVVFGDGTASRDFCFVENVVQANLLAALAPSEAITRGVFNVACGARTTLLDLYATIRALVGRVHPGALQAELVLAPSRPGDIPHSLASIERARKELGYEPLFDVPGGLERTVEWYAKKSASISPIRADEPRARAAREAS